MRPNIIIFDVQGAPAPQGSKRAVRNQNTGRISMIESSAAVKPWRQDVAAAATAAIGGVDGWPYNGPVWVDMEFRLQRPKGHYRTGRYSDQLRLGAPTFPTGRPDLDKLVRSTSDALTGVVVADDAQFVAVLAVKRYATPGERVGCEIKVEPLASRFSFDPAKNLA